MSRIARAIGMDGFRGLMHGAEISDRHLRANAEKKFKDYDNAEFLKMTEMPSLFFGILGYPHDMDQIASMYRIMYQHEFARRFYLRPLEAKPNAQDGTTLVRAV